MRYLSGIQPSGSPHIGNYFGAIAPHVALSKGVVWPGDATASDDTGFFFIADYHALTTVQDPKLLRAHVRDVAATYLALGMDAERAVFFRQSDVPEVCELTWLLATCTGKGLLERAHSYKDKTDRGLAASMGLFTYPILMAADIAIYDSDRVPVGQDQVQHVEMTQDMVTHFNSAYSGDHLRRPEHVLSETPRVIGIDGQKMSKSYHNTIPLFVEGKELKKAVNAIVTDSREPAEAKEPDSVTAYQILSLFLDAPARLEWEARLRAGGVGYGALKGALMEQMDLRFGAARVRYQHLMTTDVGEREIEAVLQRGAVAARTVAKQTLGRCLRAVGIHRAG
jgi:tryptophanyl-tRNA synthetase